MNKKIFAIFAVVLVVVLGLFLNSVFAKAEKNQNQSSENCVDKCGDGICQEVVCLATNCPCAETKKTCLKDCKVKVEENLNAADEHRSVVANFVKNLLNVADREKGVIGEQVRVIAQEQNQKKERMADQIEAIQKRNKIKKFLIGAGYKNIGALRSEMVQTGNRLEKLNKLMGQATNEADKIELQNQIKILEEEQEKIETLLKNNEAKFSLFGWFVKLFNK